MFWAILMVGAMLFFFLAVFEGVAFMCVGFILALGTIIYKIIRKIYVRN